MAGKNILLVDDEKNIRELLDYNLKKEGYNTFKAATGEHALEIAGAEKIDLVILDLMLPGIDGLEVCKILKNEDETSSIAIIMLTAKEEESDVIVGLELGADDYITKPFSPKVLLARIKAVLRRKAEKQDKKQFIKIDELVINSDKHIVSFAGKPIELTKIEFNILRILAANPGRVFTRDQLLDRAWGENTYIVDRAVDVHIRRLRSKLGGAAKLIATIRGVGYKFLDDE
jgi:two-component system phosphate regulon response regulator PhoB